MCQSRLKVSNMNPDRYGRAVREIRRSWEEVRLLQSAV